MRYFIIAGERSGDLHAGNLVKALRQHDHVPILRGIGGDQMSAKGVELIIHYRELAFMGFVEVLANMNKISKYIRQCKQAITDYKPDVVILVDYGGFNTRIAKFCKANGIRVFFYITPKVWAWYQKRALTLKKNVDRMFVILPFEKTFYKKFSWDVDYVGNPVLDAVKAHQTDPGFRNKYRLDPAKPIVALLPGSRKQELASMLPLMRKVVSRYPGVQFGLATVDNVDQRQYDVMKNIDNVIFIENDTYNLLQHARAAIVTSGTATLETALFKVPQVVLYITSFLTYHIARRIITVSYLSLVNLIADKKIVTELIQAEANENRLSEELDLLLKEGPLREQILKEYEQIYKTLDIGSASENAARLMYHYLSMEKKG